MSLLRSTRKNVEALPGLGGTQVCAIRVSRKGQVLDQSRSATVLADMWLSGEETLHAASESAFATGEPVEERIADHEGARFWIVLIPEGDACLIVARDTTLTDRMTEALMKSRTMLRELLDGAADMAFEIDTAKSFIFLSPGEAFGVPTDDWLGRRATEIFWSDGVVPARNPLSATEPTNFDAVPVSFEGQAKRWLHFTVRPQVNEDGKILSLRGTCRDMTKRYLAERQTRLDNLRLSLQQRITELLNTEESAQDLLDSASKILADILRADMVWAVVKYREGLVPVSVEGTHYDILDTESIWQTLSVSEGKVAAIDGDGRQHLAIRLERGGEGLGMMIISRNTDANPWSAQEEQLLNAVAGVLTAAFGKAELIDKLYRLSSKDELTALLNRRALGETIDRRLRHQGRTGQHGCLLFIDLDHFKEVNDTLGHAAGDKALRLVADHMQAIIRPCDYAGRYGGDEFIVWLEDVNGDHAAEKAQRLIDFMPEVRVKLGKPELQLSASVGICVTEAGQDLAFLSLVQRADAALYEVKKAGRGAIAFATASEEQNMTGEGA